MFFIKNIVRRISKNRVIKIITAGNLIFAVIIFAKSFWCVQAMRLKGVFL